MSDNGNKWDRNQILTLIGVIIAAATLVASVVIPEMRNCFGLKDGNTPAPVLPAPTPQPEPKAIPPKIKTPPVKLAAVPKQKQSKIDTTAIVNSSCPYGCELSTIRENEIHFSEMANTRLSVAFHDEYKTASITITSIGKQSSTHAVEIGYTEEFTSSAGDFILHILNVIWDSKEIAVLVSRKE